MKAIKCAALLAFLSLPAAGGDDSEPGAKPGAKLYETHCGTCHQMDGSGVFMMQPPLRRAPRANGPVGGVMEMILSGSAAVPPGSSDYNSEMPPFDFLSDEEIAAIATYVRTSFENTGGAVTPTDVADKRRSWTAN